MPEHERPGSDQGTGPWVRDQHDQRDRDLDQEEWERDPDHHLYEPGGAVDQATGEVISDADPGL